MGGQNTALMRFGHTGARRAMSCKKTRSRSKSASTHSAREVVAGALAVELAGAEVDVRGAVAVDPRLGLEAVGAGVAGVEGDCA